MIEFSPRLNVEVRCLTCESKAVSIKQIFFQGIHVLVDSQCHNCRNEFYQTLPIGHDRLFPIQFSKDGYKSNYDKQAEIWLAKPLIKSIVKYPKVKAELARVIAKPTKKIVMINCLDTCFGHVFTKLWNAQTLMKNHPDLGIVVLIPSQCARFVPLGVAEIWTVGMSLRDCDNWIDGLDEFIKHQFLRFDAVFLSNAYTHLDQTRYIDLQAFVKWPKFELSQFTTKPVCITFVVREDRFWHNSVIMDFLFKVMVKGKLQHFLKNLFNERQIKLIEETVVHLQKQLPQVKVVITGLGKSGTFGNSALDLRVNVIQDETEKQWNQVYSESQLVIGIHGSNMLIPSFLAAGFINLVPRYKIPHMAEDTCLPHSNSRYLHFLGRHLDEFSSPRLVSLHVISIIKNFPYLYRNTEQRPE